MSDDGTELQVNPKRKAAQEAQAAATAAAGKAVGGAEEMPGTPRPKPAPIAGEAKGGQEDFAKQRPRGVEEDAEVWVDPRKGGAGWTTPGGTLVDGGRKTTDPASADPRAAAAMASVPGTGAGPAPEPQERKLFEDDDVEVSSSPRRAPTLHAAPLFGGARGAAGGGGLPSRPSRAGEEDTTLYVRKPGESNVQSKEAQFTPRAPPRSDGDSIVYVGSPQGGGVGGIGGSGGAGGASGPAGRAPAATPPPQGAGPAAAGPGAQAGALLDLVRSGAAVRVLLVGSGAREHAMAAALRRNPRCEVYAVLRHRNPGIVRLASGFRLIPETQVADVVAWARAQKVHLAVVGPESGLEAGLSDALWAAGIPCASPSKAAARIETSKTFMRELMRKHEVPGQLAFHPFADEPAALAFLDQEGPVWAIKPVGLTGGKGVQVHGDHFQDAAGAKAYVKSVFAGKVGGGSLQFEELAVGEEFTVMAFCDGAAVVPMPAVQDHKRLFDGDKGPNTGGMGSYSQADGLLPFLGRAEVGEAVRILQALVDALRAEGTPYVGTIYGQFMLTRAGPKVIEVNARFGDPEAVNVLHALESDYVALLAAMCAGALQGMEARFRPAATVVRYVVPKGYAEAATVESRPVQVDEFNIRRQGGTLYYASIQQEQSGVLATQGSRALAVLGEGKTLEEAEAACTRSLRHIHGNGLHVRLDIGTAALLQRRIEHMQAVRSQRAVA